MTLIDTVPGFSATLAALGDELGVAFPAEDLTRRLGPPLDHLLADHLAPEAVAGAGDRFRELYRDHAIAPTPVLAGAHEAIAAVRRQRGRVLLVTGKFPRNAGLHVDHLGLDVDHVEGWVWGVGKADVLRAEGASVYVGDHVHDVEGALAAGATSVSVLTGGSTRAELEAAGTHVVLDDLLAFPDWLEEHLLTTRLAALEADLAGRESVLVAFSGGADSALVLAAAVRALGPDRVAAATAYSDSLPASERGPAADFAASLGIPVLTPATREMEREGYRANSGQRCYFCKAELLDVLGPLAEEHGLRQVATGTNADDVVAGFRPGIRAAAERGAITPLADAGLTKAQVREASRRWGLPTWAKPAAACLSSRIAYGLEISPARLARVERAEAEVRRVLARHGLESADLRVRDRDDHASVELDADLVAGDLAGRSGAGVVEEVCAAVRAAGFAEAGLDRRGFRSGSLNDDLAPDRADNPLAAATAADIG
ncbi:HAD hydrolase-like protein [Nocardioides sp. MJB4]|uniref:HAD hydrolase-like protein n=2 Tax=Nocardioides donggukensis TaxID=2774019 RepID=A0A927PZ53_9ACTN|nr:HAD hydrolase-like protein [Nocardioides donggukensis]